MGKLLVFLVLGAATGILYSLYWRRQSHDSLLEEAYSIMEKLEEYDPQVISSFVERAKQQTTPDEIFRDNPVSRRIDHFMDRVSAAAENRKSDSPPVSWQSKTEDQSRWRTPSAIVQEIRKTLIGEWKHDDVEIKIESYYKNCYLLEWTNGEDDVRFILYPDKVVCQNWIFDSTVMVNKRFSLSNNDLIEHYDLPKAGVFFKRQSQPHERVFSWRHDEKDVESLKRARRYILAWCEANRDWVSQLGVPCDISGFSDEEIF